MKTKRILTIAALTAILATLAVAGVVMAQTATPPTPGSGYMGGRMGHAMGGAGMRGAWGGPDNAALTIVADQLDLERSELINELQDGPQSVAQVAEAHNVALDTIVDAVLAPRADHLADMVTAGTITQAQADQMLVTMRAHIQASFQQPWAPHETGDGWTDANGDGVCDEMGNGQMSGYRGGRMGGMMGRTGGMMGRWQQQ